MRIRVAAPVLALLLSACVTNPRMLLNTAIGEFSKAINEGSRTRIWITGPIDACASGSSSGAAAAGGMLSFLPGGGGGDANDDMALEVFTNYLTQKHRGRVIEKHRANYATDTNAQTRIWVTARVEGTDDAAKPAIVGTAEDLCILDEAKKRYAEKVLAYEILKVTKKELQIHLRLSDVPTGLIEHSRTLQVIGASIGDL